MVLVLGAVLLGRVDFQELRPTVAEKLDYSDSTPLRIQARLWQDPFSAVQEFDRNRLRQAPVKDQPILNVMVKILRQKLDQPLPELSPHEAAARFVDCWRSKKGTEGCDKLVAAMQLESLHDDIKNEHLKEFAAQELGIAGVETESISPSDDAPRLNDACRATANQAFDFQRCVLHAFLGAYSLRKPLSMTHLESAIANEVVGLGVSDVNSDIITKAAEARRAGHAVVFLGVMVPGGPYADMAERRMRSRYALIAALASEGYTPDEPEYIRVWRSPAGRCILPDTCVVRDAPYEWFSVGESGSHHPKILVMWFRDEELADWPIAKTAAIAHLMDGALRLQTNGQGFDVRFLGPYSSGSYINAQQEQFCTPGDPRHNNFSYVDNRYRTVLNDVGYINWSATVSRAAPRQKDPGCDTHLSRNTNRNTSACSRANVALPLIPAI